MKINYQNTLRLGSTLALALSAAFTARADYSSTVLSQSPAAYYRLNSTEQPAVNGVTTNLGWLGTSANGTYANSPTRQLAGPFAGSFAVGFDGISQNISTPNLPDLNHTNAFSAEFWVKPATILTSGNTYIASTVDFAANRSGWYLSQDSGATFGHGSAFVVRMFNHVGATQSGEVWAAVGSTNTWYHVVLTYNGTTAALYTNGVLAMSAAVSSYFGNANSTYPFTVGSRNVNAQLYWAGQLAEVAQYTNALTLGQITSHYTTATTAPASYFSTVQADLPALYHRYREVNDVVAVNSSAVGISLNGKFQVGTAPGVAGPQTPGYLGLEATNKAVAFNASGASVSLPPFNFNTNTVTISCWINASNVQTSAAGIVVCDSGATYAGLTIDGATSSPGLGLGYVWANDPNTYFWSPSVDGSTGGGGPFLPALPDSDWAYVALVIRPNQAEVYLGTTNGGVLTFTSVTNVLSHGNQSFAGPTLIGTDALTNSLSLNGAVDEVGLWKRSLSGGELYTQFASAVGGIAPKILADPVSPTNAIFAGDTLTLTVDAGGTPNLGYQWYSNSVAIGGATTAAYIKTNFNIVSDIGTYYAVVTNAFGSATSASATVTGQSPTAPNIVSGPVGRTIYPNGTLNLTVVATGGGIQYQWKRAGTNLPGATAASYIVPAVTTNNAGTYTVTVSNLLGGTVLGPAVITVPVLASNTYPQIVAADAPEAWWRLDESSAPSGSTMADAMARHDGSYTNIGGLTMGTAGPILAGAVGTAAHFNGDGSFGISPPSSVYNGGDFTMECWARLATVLNGVSVASAWNNNNGYSIGTQTGNWYGQVGDSGTGYIFGQGPGVTAGYNPAITPGQWVHLVITHSPAGNATFPYRVYINGSADGFIYGEGTFSPNTPFIIGGRGTGDPAILDRFITGDVDEVAFYNKALTTAQILAHYNAAFFGAPPSFTTQPKSVNVFPGDNATFTAAVAGTAPITLQWRKNGVSLTGQTNSSLTISNLFYTDSTNKYTLLATNFSGATVSSNVSAIVTYPPLFAYLTNGLVLHMAFEGNYNDTSGHANNGTPTGSPSLVAGKIGTSALTYSTDTGAGFYNYVALGTPTDLLFSSNVSFSVSYWTKFPVGYTNGDLPILSSALTSYGDTGITFAPSYQRGGWSWSLVPASGSAAALYGADNSVNNGNWHNLVHVFSRSGAVTNATTYLDGVLVNTTSLVGVGDVDSGLAFNIGQGADGLYQETGTNTVDDIGIWRRALTDYEAKSIYIVGQNYNKSFDTVGPVILNTVALPGGGYGITWQSGTLQKANDLLGPWSTVAGATAPFYQFSITATNTFYRVAP